MSGLDGVLVVDKPAGPTSHDVVAAVRRFTRPLRVGHTGTLDPFATGVLPLCVGRATRLSRFLTSTRKLYSGVIRLGVVTDTGDAEGRVLTSRPVDGVTPEAVRRAAARLTGEHLQIPPAFSARKVDGRPMHRLARLGIEVTPAPAPVTIHRFEILETGRDTVRFEVETSPGTYVRALARDLGEDLGCGGHLVELRRLASGPFRVDQAHRMEEILELGRRGAIGSMIVPMNALDLGLPTVRTTAGGAEAMRHGRAITAGEIVAGTGAGAAAGTRQGGLPAGPVRVEDERGDLLGVARPASSPGGEPLLRPEVVLAGG